MVGTLRFAHPQLSSLHIFRHCEERSDEAIQTVSAERFLDCLASLAMTGECHTGFTVTLNPSRGFGIGHTCQLGW
jgi:hypothetical protein